jgi:hypothetical protein
MEVVARLSADSVPKAARSSGARYRSAVTNDPRFLPKRPLSRRALDRRRKDLVSSFLSALGPDAMNGLTAVMVRKAAELTVAAEVARANMLNGVPTDMLALVRLEGVAARAVRVLGIKVEKPRGGDGGLTIARARWEEQRAQEQAEKAREATTAKDTEVPPDGRAT